MCINGKCVYEHENAVDYEGRGNFLRKSGDFDEHENNIIDTPAPAQPTNERYTPYQIKSMKMITSVTC